MPKVYRIVRTMIEYQRTFVLADSPDDAAKKCRSKKITWETFYEDDAWEAVVLESTMKAIPRPNPR